ncbi:MAG: hypothetical protein CMI01_15420 [Oceanospirillaceae bacterium]|nr:hypothetical protein [Oceanospirillaceae bacterium]
MQYMDKSMIITVIYIFFLCTPSNGPCSRYLWAMIKMSYNIPNLWLFFNKRFCNKNMNFFFFTLPLI